MYIIHKTVQFDHWLDQLRDVRARTHIAKRLLKIQNGNLGDWKSIGNGISEIRVDIGAGYRLYFTRQGLDIIFLLCAGDKSSQRRDIEMAKSIAEQIWNSI
ncbi:MAG: type II toxin-antitoxin system RelE/ParE family toxin [Arenimonas sp.]|nr:type II toxin-antitoxin system RelE/ParE family toxin [Arenimonas sp.]MBP7917404.1 type II toxin-antitoxin system RelE/ParE family toxin [Arenimonas sp.]